MQVHCHACINVIPADEAKTLLKGMPEVQQALFIEQALEENLRITDEPVEGEVAR